MPNFARNNSFISWNLCKAIVFFPPEPVQGCNNVSACEFLVQSLNPSATKHRAIRLNAASQTKSKNSETGDSQSGNQGNPESDAPQHNYCSYKPGVYLKFTVP